MRARACIKCKKYVLIHPGNQENLELVKEFEGSHRGHTVITTQLDEIKGEYKNVADKEESLPISA